MLTNHETIPVLCIVGNLYKHPTRKTLPTNCYTNLVTCTYQITDNLFVGIFNDGKLLDDQWTIDNRQHLLIGAVNVGCQFRLPPTSGVCPQKYPSVVRVGEVLVVSLGKDSKRSGQAHGHVREKKRRRKGVGRRKKTKNNNKREVSATRITFSNRFTSWPNTCNYNVFTQGILLFSLKLLSLHFLYPSKSKITIHYYH